MAKRREVVLTKDGFRCVFYAHESYRELINVDVFDGETLVLEWTYPRLKGAWSLQGSAGVWLDQAVLEAKSQKEKQK